MQHEGPTYSQEHMRKCLVRAVIAMRETAGSANARAWLDTYERKNKDATLREEVFEQFERGNRGKWGDWREPSKG